MAEDKSVLTFNDRAQLMPVVRGEYPSEPALAVVEQIVREHLGRALNKDLG